MNRRDFLKKLGILVPLTLVGAATHNKIIFDDHVVWTMDNNNGLRPIPDFDTHTVVLHFTYDITVGTTEHKSLIQDEAFDLIAAKIKDNDIFQVRRWRKQYYVRMLGSSFKQMYKEGSLSNHIYKQHAIYVESLYSQKFTANYYDEHGRGHGYYHDLEYDQNRDFNKRMYGV